MRFSASNALQPSVCLITLGCKVNQYESDLLAAQFAAGGFRVLDGEEKADIYVINSCTVTAVGDKKTRQILHRCRRENPAALIALTGCFVQAFPERAELLPEWDILCGNTRRRDLLRLVRRAMETGEKVVQVEAHLPNETFEPMQVPSFAHKTRAFVKIEDGCNRFCSYCIIPYARGRVRSKALSDLEHEVSALAAAGYREIVLIGINLSSYGMDIGLRLIDAVEACCRVPGVCRVRLGSLEPELLTHADLKRMAALPQFCPQFHLALQSGSDSVLKRMNRHYDTAEYLRIVQDIRDCFENPAITTDIMVGFPGETEEEHLQSIAFAKAVGFAQMHVFTYSAREGTPAAKLPQLDGQVKKARTTQMLACKAELEDAFLRSQIGKKAEIILESHVTAQGGSFYAEGYTRNYTPVYLKGESEKELAALRGRLLLVELVGERDGRAAAKLIEEKEYCRKID